MQFLRKILLGLVKVPGELLLVQHDGIVVLLEVADSTECERVCMPLTPFITSHELSFGRLPSRVVDFARDDEVVYVYTTDTNEFVSVILEEDTLIELMDSPAQRFKISTNSMVPCTWCISQPVD